MTVAIDWRTWRDERSRKERDRRSLARLDAQLDPMAEVRAIEELAATSIARGQERLAQDPEHAWRLAVGAQIAELGLRWEWAEADSCTYVWTDRRAACEVPDAVLSRLASGAACPQATAHLLAAVVHDARFAPW